MILSSRMVTFNALPNVVVPAGAAICDRIKELTGLEISLWMGGPGFPVGTYAWSSEVESHAQFAELGAKIQGDAKYIELVGELAQHSNGQGEHNLQELVHAGGEVGGSGVGSSAWIVTAQIADGQLSKAMTWAVEITDLVANTTGTSPALFRNLYGPWGAVSWITVLENAAAVDDAMAKLGTSESYMAKLDTGGGLFVTGSATSGLATRVH